VESCSGSFWGKRLVLPAIATARSVNPASGTVDVDTDALERLVLSAKENITWMLIKARPKVLSPNPVSGVQRAWKLL
jgi:hypothetical protein